MTIFGVIFVLSGIGSIIYGVNLNNNLASQLKSLWNSGSTNPGTTYIIIGVIAIIVGLIMIYAGLEKDKEKRRIIQKSMDKNEDIEIDGSWVCSNCGTSNNSFYSNCERCGKEFVKNRTNKKNDETSKIMPEYWLCENCGNKNMAYLIKCSKCGLEINENDNDNTSEQSDRFEQSDWKELLIKNGLKEYIGLFETNKLDTNEIICELNENDLEKLGITIMGDRKKIIKIFNLN
jgi:DNA-directed RNA polymerase subunit RPC12/RpoP